MMHAVQTSDQTPLILGLGPGRRNRRRTKMVPFLQTSLPWAGADVRESRTVRKELKVKWDVILLRY